ncbi:MAG: endolytic transglycosylase MltG [Alphaproteobacteria bacterium]|nr:MAG: endolytic transglycosylase MltG [Alphaproteobacteria bacterium]
MTARRWLFAGLLLVVAVAAGTGFWLSSLHRDFTAPGMLQAPRIVLLARGTSLRGAAAMLEREGVVDDAQRFYWAARFFGGRAPVIAGEYAVPAHASMAQALGILQSGAVVQHRFTVPEGATVADVLVRLRAEPLLSGAIAQSPPEGSLLPETYFFARGDARQDLIARMQAAMEESLAAAWAARRADLPLQSPREAVILASIVERETAIPAERARIAAVFLNRLKRGMRLQSDPTVIYGLAGGRLDRPLTRRDLEKATPYNTYQIDGLPPTPIANPGRDSLVAVLNPLDSDELYFVADGAGGHVFAHSHREHLRNVAKWRRIQSTRQQQEKTP